MTDWFENKQTPLENGMTPEEGREDSSRVAADPPQTTPTASFGDPAQPESGSPSASGWHTPGTDYGYAAGSSQTPPTGSGSQTGGSGTGGYQPQGGYTPYGSWQPSSSFTPPQAPSGGGTQGPKKPRKKPSSNGILAAALSVVCVICLVLGGVLIFQNTAQTPGTGVTSSGTNTDASEDDSSKPTVALNNTEITDGGLTTTEIVAKNINSTVVIKMYTRQSQNGFYFSAEGTETMAGQASGIVMSEDGYIITNQHVVYNENTGEYYDRIDVEFYDGSVYTADVIGADQDTDLAVIKIDATGLTPVTFGNSDNLNLGDRVVTLGNSGGLPWTVSQGIISGLDRDVYDETGYSIKCLQIDAVINPGNSGGPLFNAAGEVVGVNSAKIVYEGYEGLGFSIPISEAKPVIDDIIANGYATGRIALRITGYTVTQSGYEGFMIDTIQSDSSLNGTGAQQGDIITHVNGTRVRSYAELKNALSQHAVGDTVELTLMRVNRRTGQYSSFTVSVQLQENQE